MVGGDRRLEPAAFVAAVLVAVFLSPAAEAETAAAGASLRPGPFESIFAFGDSFTDTGNSPVAFYGYSPIMRPPYGMTFFHGVPTGRFCNGRLLIDFVAHGLGLPLVPPFFHIGDGPGAYPLPINISLEVQLGWFEEPKPSLCKTDQDCKDFFGKSLFFVGEFGINDYQFSFGKKSMQEIRAFVPDLIETISKGAERLIGHGAKTLVIPGMIPSGCAPPVLVTFANAHASEYDAATGCLKEPNKIAMLHNSLLRYAIHKLRAKHPDVTIIHTDLFNHVTKMVKSPEKFGFKKDLFTIGCGGPGRYHYNLSNVCGDEAATTCEDPSTRLFWDGVHLTEAAYHYIAEDWLNAIVGSLSARASS
ncbi:unnamed protein product [Urochloa decumbens]|uniref:GDSL esterase/lipase n=1 Tax=Urochloa decumbens TaxID=240449 RepID=A0ABC8WPX1_9POAL